MALIKCPECRKEVDDAVKICPECGYQLNEVDGLNTSITVNKKNRHLAVGACIIGCMLLIFAFRTITSSKYYFYIENYGTYVAEYEENLESANSYNWGFLKRGYRNIASRYENMANEAKKAIWIYRIKAIVAGGVGIVLIIGGYKKLKKKRVV